jgi:hypothetical protein
MAIRGFRVTTLATYGAPGKASGPFHYTWLVSMEFPLGLVGPFDGKFEDPLNFQSAQVADAGIRLIVQVLNPDGTPVNVAPADELIIKLLNPDGTSQDFTAQILNAGDDGRIYYDTAVADLAEAGLYQIQAKVDMGGSPKATRLGAFMVDNNVDNN